MENPYRPPGADFENQLSVPLGLVRPTSVTVFGVLNIVFGSMVLLCTPFSLAMANLPNQPGQSPDDPLVSITRNPTYRTGLLALGGVGLIAAAVELVAGIGLLKMKPWGRVLSVGFGLFSFVQLVIVVSFQYIYLLQPIMKKAAELRTPQMEMTAMLYKFIVFGSPLVGVIYPTLLLIFMTRPRIVEAFRRYDKFGPGAPEFS